MDDDSQEEEEYTGEKTVLLTTSHEQKGLTMFSAILVLVSSMLGTGIITNASAMARTGLAGIGLTYLVVILVGYAAILLGKLFLIAQTHRGKTEVFQDPYPYMGELAFGKWGRHVITIVLQANLIQCNVIFYILISEMISDLSPVRLKFVSIHEEFRLWMAIVTLIFLPLCWLESPKDFWLGGLIVVPITIIAAVAILTSLYLVPTEARTIATRPDRNIVSFSSGLGTFLFTYSSVGVLPTIQSDMKDPRKFPRAIILCYFIIVIFILPCAVLGYLVFGKQTASSILINLSGVPGHDIQIIVTLVKTVMVAHFMFAFVMMSNPISQQFEGYFGINGFSWQRCCVRSLVVLAISGMGQIFPKFGPVIDLTGGLLSMILCYMFPPIAYYRMCSHVPLWHKILIFITVFTCIILCGFCTYSSFINIIDGFKSVYLVKGKHA